MEKAIYSNIIPTFRYKNAKEAIDWLCTCFGFQKKVVFEDEKGGIAHAQLSYGNAMIMLGTVRENEYDKYIKLPDEVSGYNTLSLYIVVKDIEAHYQKVKNSGVKICVPLTWEDYGGGVYTCKDLEGYLWSFGSYDPWAKS